MLIRLLLVAVVGVLAVRADSKKEVQLKTALAAAEQARLVAVQERSAALAREAAIRQQLAAAEAAKAQALRDRDVQAAMEPLLRKQIEDAKAAKAAIQREQKEQTDSVISRMEKKDDLIKKLAALAPARAQQVHSDKENNETQAKLAQISKLVEDTSAEQANRSNTNTNIIKESAEEATNNAAKAATEAASAKAQTTALFITQLFGFGTLLAGFLWKGYTEHRDHQWATEKAERDRVLAAEERKANHDLMIEKLGVVEKKASQAYAEANHVNQKIESIGQKLVGEAVIAKAEAENLEGKTDGI